MLGDSVLTPTQLEAVVPCATIAPFELNPTTQSKVTFGDPAGDPANQSRLTDVELVGVAVTLTGAPGVMQDGDPGVVNCAEVV